MPDVEHGQSDAESLTRKLRRLEPELTVGERRILDRLIAVAAVPGTASGPGGRITAVVGPADPGASVTGAAEDSESLRAQFRDAFTPGPEWPFGGAGDIGLIR